MKNTFGSSVSVTIFGESHGKEIGAILDGMAPGIAVDETFIEEKLALRRPSGAISTKRVEPDHFRILSGVYNGYTTGTPICIAIPNQDTRSKDYSATRFLARPGHADYTAWCKYHGFEDYRGGGHFSGRITAGLVACGAIALSALLAKGIRIGSHVASCAGIKDRHFEDYDRDIDKLNGTDFAVLDQDAGEKMQETIKEAARQGDSVGGILETVITGLPKGVGEPWFDSLEGVLAHALFSIPAVKGVEFGDGFALAGMRGSQANDSFVVMDSEDNERKKIITRSNHNGGINGGISNGMPVIFRLAIKPTPTISIEQNTVDFKNNTNEKLASKGRHDPAIVHRARIVADSVAALVICDMLAQRFGTDYLGGTTWNTD